MEKDMCTRAEVEESLERFNKVRDVNLENKLLRQKADIIKEVYSAIGKIPLADTTPLSNRMDKRFDDIDKTYKDLQKEVDAMQIKMTIMSEQLSPIKKIVWSVLFTMITAIVGAVIGLIVYK
jgi:hypothetical protein